MGFVSSSSDALIPCLSRYLGLYVACLVRLRYHYRQFSLTRNELHALKHQDRIFMSVSVIIVLYIVFHAVPNVATVVMNVRDLYPD